MCQITAQKSSDSSKGLIYVKLPQYGSYDQLQKFRRNQPLRGRFGKAPAKPQRRVALEWVAHSNQSVAVAIPGSRRFESRTSNNVY